MPADTRHYVQWRDRQKKRRLADSELPKNKKRRQKNFHAKMKEHAKDAKKERAKRDGGLCMPGVGLDGGYIIAKEDIPAPVKKKWLPSVCPLPLCRIKGHKTKRSLNGQCNPKNPNYIGDQPAAANLKADDTPQPSIPTADPDQQQEVRDTAEQDIVDSLPLDADFCSAEEFSSGHSSVENNDIDSANDDDSIGGNISDITK